MPIKYLVNREIAERITGVKTFQSPASLLVAGQRAKTHFTVAASDLLTPPGSPTEGDHYLLPSGTLTGAWAGFSNGSVAAYTNGAWIEIQTADGDSVTDVATGFHHMRSAGVWRAFPFLMPKGVRADGTTDDGAAIADAMAAAGALGGGILLLPPGVIRSTVEWVHTYPGVVLAGAGIGFFNTAQPANPTVVLYDGAVGGTPLYFGSTSGASEPRLVGAGVVGLTIDGNGKAADGFVGKSFTQCRVDVAVKGCTNWQIRYGAVTTLSAGIARDVQENIIDRLEAKATGSAGGIELQTDTIGANISYQEIGYIRSDHENGTGIFVGNCDNATFANMRAFRGGGGAGWGIIFGAGDNVNFKNARGNICKRVYANGGIYFQGLEVGVLPSANNYIEFDEENATAIPKIGILAESNRIFSNLGLSAPFPVIGAPATIKMTDRNGAANEKIFQFKRELGDLLLQAVNDVQMTGTDASMTAGSAVLTSPTGGFTGALVGQRIRLWGAGTGGDVYTGAVSTVDSATQLTLSAVAATTVSGEAFSIGETGGNAIAIVGNGNAILELDIRGTADLNIAGGSLKFGDTERVDSSGNATFNSLDFDSGAASWSPTWGATSGSVTTVTVVSARYQQIGNVVFYSIIATITDNGTGAAALTFTLPSTPLYGGAGTGKNTSTGETLNTTIAASNGTATVHKYNATYPVATGNAIRLTGFYIV